MSHSYDYYDEESSNQGIDALHARVEELTALYQKLTTDSSKQTKILEDRLREQEVVCEKLMEAVGQSFPQDSQEPANCDDTESSGLNFSFEAMQAAPGVSSSSSTSNTGSESPKHSRQHDLTSRQLKISQHSVHTQTSLAIDPQTSVKLSFISAGISTYGSTIEDTMTASSGSRRYANRSARGQLPPEFGSHQNISGIGPNDQDSPIYHYGTPFRPQRQELHSDQNDRSTFIPPSSQQQSYHDHYRHQQEQIQQKEHQSSLLSRDGSSGDPEESYSLSTVPPPHASSIPIHPYPPYHNTQATPLKSIMRTPTRPPPHTPIVSVSLSGQPTPVNKGPLHAYSPSLSPINSIHSTLNYSAYDDSNYQSEHRSFHDQSAGRQRYADSHTVNSSLEEFPQRRQQQQSTRMSRGFAEDEFLYEQSVATPAGPREGFSSDSDSLHSLSMLNVTDATLATLTDRGGGSYGQELGDKHRPPRPSITPSRNQHESHPLSYSTDDRYRSNHSSHGQGSVQFLRGSRPLYSSSLIDSASPLRHSYAGSPSLFRHSESTARLQSMQYTATSQRTPASQKPSKFWKNRLSTRDMTSVLGSPVSLSLFS